MNIDLVVLLKSESPIGYSFISRKEAIAFSIIDFPESFLPTTDVKLDKGISCNVFIPL